MTDTYHADDDADADADDANADADDADADSAGTGTRADDDPAVWNRPGRYRNGCPPPVR